MDNLIQAQTNGEGGVLLVDLDFAAARVQSAEAVSVFHAAPEASLGRAEFAAAYALPPMPRIPSRKFFRH